MTDPVHTDLSAALYAIRQEVGPLLRDSEADTGKFKYKFISLPSLVEKVDPIAVKHGVFIRHQLNGSVLRHELWFNNEMIETFDIDLPNPQETAQGFGSAVTYLRRYDYTTTLGLVVDLDDDGAGASRPAPQSTTPREPPQRPVAASGPPAEATDLPDDF